MKKLGAILVAAGLLSFSFGAQVRAQKIEAVPPPVTGSRLLKPVTGYNPDKLETISGRVVEVRRNIPKKEGAPVMLQLVVQTEKETIPVPVAPANFVDQQKFTFAMGDQVEIRGSRFTGPKEVSLIAGEIIKGGKILKLRDEAGNPLWGKGRKRPGY